MKRSREENLTQDTMYCIEKGGKKLHERKVKETRENVRKMRKLPTQDLMDEDFVKIRYIRYADDFLIMVIGDCCDNIR